MIATPSPSAPRLVSEPAAARYERHVDEARASSTGRAAHPAQATGSDPTSPPRKLGDLVRTDIVSAETALPVHGDDGGGVADVPDRASRHLLASPVVRKLGFTGSAPFGQALMKRAADRVLRMTMELDEPGDDMGLLANSRRPGAIAELVDDKRAAGASWRAVAGLAAAARRASSSPRP